MQHIKDTKNVSALKEVAYNDIVLTDSLAKVIDKFEIDKHLSSFNILKDKGFSIGSLLKVSVMLPFLGTNNVYALLKHGITGLVKAKKDAFYAALNNEWIDWRKVHYMVAKRFKYLVSKDVASGGKRVTAIIFDDTLLEKTGKGTEKISVMHDHVTNRFVLGFKLLLCGFWDGVSFIPLDFTLHREKGSRQEEITNQYQRATKALGTTKELLNKAHQQLGKYQKKHSVAELKMSIKPNILNNILLKQTIGMLQNAKAEIQTIEIQLVNNTMAQADAKLKLKRMYTHGRLFGLTKSERKAQYKKSISAKSCGYARRKEADRSKGEQLLVMLKRAVKNNFIPQYVLTDSWFFCESMLIGIKSIRNGCIDLISMVKINNQVFEYGKDRKEIGVKQLLNNCITGKSSYCKKFHASYYKRNCNYKGTALNLFFVKMGRSSNWHLLATTDLNLNFVDLMETYQIRWSVEICFHDCKSYLNLGKCKASNFDAQIADATINMIRYVMLSYCNRINYQTTFGGLFTELSAERMRNNLLYKLLDIFWILVKECSFSAGFDMIIIQRDIMQNPEMANRIEKLMTGTVFNNAA
jgi:hypothetical protein